MLTACARQGHDRTMQAVIDALPVKPKKNRAIKVRAQRCLGDLLQRFRLYETLDADGDCELSKAECAAAPESQLVTRAGGSLVDAFDEITGGMRLMNFADFYAHVVVRQTNDILTQGGAPAESPTCRGPHRPSSNRLRPSACW